MRTITVWSALDSVGRIRLSTGEEVRFGASACRFPPALGLAVHVWGLEPHRLGGNKASRVDLVSPGDADLVRDANVPLPGMMGSPEELAGFVELTDEVGLLGVVLKQPLRSRAALRDWFNRAGIPVDFSNPGFPLVRAGNVSFRVWLCMAEVGGGEGIVSFALNTTFSVSTERELTLARALLQPDVRVTTMRMLGPFTELVRRCAEGEVAVIAHQARGFIVPATEWIARAADTSHAVPIHAWVRTIILEGREPMMSGMGALHLPDLFLRGADQGDAAALLESAGLELIELGRIPEVGLQLGRCKVVSADKEWVWLQPPG